MAHADPEDGEEVTTVGVEDCVAVLKWVARACGFASLWWLFFPDAGSLSFSPA
jgi:hypothetical protein